MWLSNPFELLCKNIRSMTELEPFSLSKYLVGTRLVGTDKSRLNESAMISELSLMEA